MSDRRRAIGALGEDATAAWYRERGYEIVARNWHVREGEIDIVARSGRVLVICEVKTRSSDAFGQPVEAITRTKRQRLRKLAGLFVASHPQPGCTIRFDVASVRPTGNGPDVDVLEAAF